MISKIVTAYHARVAFDLDGASVNKMSRFTDIVCDFAFRQAPHHVIAVEINKGGPCWGPYITAMCADREKLVQWVKAVECKILSYRGAKIESNEGWIYAK